MRWPIGCLLWLCLTTAASAQTLQMASGEWAPYIGSELKRQGVVAQILQEALQTQGATLHVRFLPWPRAYKATARGDYDLLAPAYVSAERKLRFLVSEPFLDTRVGFFTLPERPVQFDGLASLLNYRIGVVRGYANLDAFDRAAFLDKEWVNSDLQNLEKLLRGRIDLAVMDQFTGQYLLATEAPIHLRSVRFVEPPLAVKPLHVLIGQQHPQAAEILEMVNKGLQVLKAQGRIEAILQAELPPRDELADSRCGAGLQAEGCLGGQ